MVAKLLEYTPGVRLSAIEAMTHQFFDELRVEGARMPNGKEFPLLFDFTREGKRCDPVGIIRLSNLYLNRTVDSTGFDLKAGSATLRIRAALTAYRAG